MKNLYRTFSTFFMDSNGALSMMRLCTFVLVLGGLVFAYVHPDHETGYISIITLGLGGKSIQKHLENNKSKNTLGK